MSLTYVTKKLEDQTLEEGELGSQKVRFFFNKNDLLPCGEQKKQLIFYSSRSRSASNVPPF